MIWLRRSHTKSIGLRHNMPPQHPVSPTAPRTVQPAKPYDALLLASFGGPNKPEDVVPFLRNVVRGKNIPDARLEEVGEHYYGFGGRSPINEQNLALRHAIEAELRSRGVRISGSSFVMRTMCSKWAERARSAVITVHFPGSASVPRYGWGHGLPGPATPFVHSRSAHR